jgi:hypothetical protein
MILRKGIWRTLAGAATLLFLVSNVDFRTFHSKGHESAGCLSNDLPAERNARKPKLNVIAYTDGRVATAFHPHASLCHALKGWVANNVEGTLLWGSDAKIGWTGSRRKSDRVSPNLPERHPVEFDVTSGKWLHTVTKIARIREDDLVLLVDAFDAYFQLPPEIIVQRYFEELMGLPWVGADKSESRESQTTELTGAENRLVFSAEAWCSPWSWWPPWMGQSESKGKPLCDLFKGRRWPGDFGIPEGKSFGDVRWLAENGQRAVTVDVRQAKSGARRLDKRELDGSEADSNDIMSDVESANESGWANVLVRMNSSMPIPRPYNEHPMPPPPEDPSILTARFPNTGMLLGPPSLFLRFSSLFM